jgi:hypothetical protein
MHIVPFPNVNGNDCFWKAMGFVLAILRQLVVVDLLPLFYEIFIT